MSLLVVGSMAFDAIETPFGKTDKIVGGAATYISHSASFFYKDIKLLSVVGGDFPTSELEELKQKGADVSGVEIREDEKTFFWSGKYHFDLNTRDTLVTELNVLADFNPTVPENYANSKYLMLGNLDPEVQISVIKQMKKRPELIVMDTMNFWMDIKMDKVKEAISMVDILTINDEEARQLSGEYALPKAAQAIMNLGPKHLIIKKGEHGALLFSGQQIFFAPALPLEEVMDPTGAGDTFAGGFIGYLADTGDFDFDDMKNSIVFGSVMASFCVEKFGTERLKSINGNEVLGRYKKFRDIVEYKDKQ